MANFLGIQQVKYSTFLTKTQSEKIGYLWLVSHESGETATANYEIYFGSRKYGSSSDVFIANVIDSFGGLMDAEGGFIFPVGEDDFLTIDESQVDNLYQLLKAFDAAINSKVNSTKLDEYYTKTEIDGKVGALQTAIDACLKSVSVKVGDAKYDGVVTDGKAVIDLTEAFDAAGKVKDVQVDGASVVDENGVATIIIPEVKVPFQSVAEGDKVLSLSENGVLSSDLSFGVDAEPREDGKKYIFVNGKDGVEIGKVDTTDFVVDGMLKTVAPKEEGSTVLVFTFNEESGQNPIEVDFAKYVDVYKADETSLTLDSSTNTFSLKSADATKVQVSEIPVGGTPLADILTENNITSITANNLQAVLESLFSQNLWAENPRRNIPSALSVSMSNPSISLDKSGTQEVGTTVNLSASAKTASASAKITYSGFTYGYSAENDNSKDGDTPASVSITGTVVEGSDYALSFVTNNGFGGEDVADVAGSSTSGNSLIVAEGTNKVTVTASSPSFTATVPAQNAVYACSSLKKTDAEHVVAASESSTINGDVKTATANTSITGAYKLYVGYTDSAVSTSDGIKSLATHTGWTNGSSATTFGGGTFPAGKVSNIAMPSTWKLNEVLNGMNLVITDNFATKTEVDYVLPDNTTVKYTVYSNLYGADVVYNSITIKK